MPGSAAPVQGKCVEAGVWSLMENCMALPILPDSILPSVYAMMESPRHTQA
jgi:hypothetical protein